jgi:hypothetical protein
MAVEITSDTVVKILVRRGLETERKNVTLTEGELGYSVDTQRLFIGDGYTVGGNAVGNKNFGVIADKNSILSYLQTGDFLIENNLPLFYNNGTFSSFVPVVYSDPINSMNTIEYVGAPYNSLRLPTDTIGDGFILDYSVAGNGQINNTLQQKYGQINFDGRYISLCASAGSFYIGNIFTKQISNNLTATLNVDQEIFVNDTNTNPFQLQIYAKDPAATSNSLIEAISGGVILKGRASSGLLVAGSTSTQPQVLVKNNGGIQLGPTSPTQGYASPGNTIYGVSRFLSSAYFDQNVWIAGTLSANTVAFVNSTTTQTSSLSVFTSDSINETVFFGNSNPIGTQTILRIVGNSGAGLQPYAIVKDNSIGSGSVIAINHDPGINSQNYNVAISGSVGISTAGAAGTTNRVDINSPTLNLKGVTSTLSGTAGTINFGTLNLYGGSTSTTIRAGAGTATDYVDIQGNLRATYDITAFYSSDTRLKDNQEVISSALEKIDKISGISFNWNETSGKSGKDYGVLAQQVEQVLPEIVTTRPDGYKAVNYEKLIPLLIEAIKELKDLKK